MSSLVMVMADPFVLGNLTLPRCSTRPTCGRSGASVIVPRGMRKVIPGDLIAPLLSAYQDLANGSTFTMTYFL